MGTKLVLLVDFWDHIFKTVFPIIFFLVFYSKTPKCLVTCVKCVTRCVTAKIYTWNYLFWSNFTYKLSYFSTSLTPHYQNNFTKYFFLFSTLHSRMSKNMCIWRHKLCNTKTGVGPTFTWSNEPWSKASHLITLHLIFVALGLNQLEIYWRD